MKTISIGTAINSVTDYRLEWYDTPRGPRQMHCACTPHIQCCYHFYTLQNPGYRPRPVGLSVPEAVAEPVRKRSPGKQPRPASRPAGKPPHKPQQR